MKTSIIMVVGRLASFDMGAINLAMCILDMETKRIHEWRILNIFRTESIVLGREIKSSDRTVDQHVEAMIQTLEDHSELFYGITHVAIEQQPAGRGRFANNKMSILQHSLKTWFLTKYHVCATIVSPKLKLRIIRKTLAEDDALLDPQPSTPKNARKRYAYHKKRAIQCVQKLGALHATETQMVLFRASKKKDDYADALLQGLWHIFELEQAVLKELKKTQRELNARLKREAKAERALVVKRKREAKLARSAKK